MKAITPLTPSLDPLLVAQGIPEAAARAVELARHAADLVRRTIDGDVRQLAVGRARQVDERHRFRRPIEPDERLGLEQVHLRDEHRRERSLLPRDTPVP
jgi:hypothetical protein